MGGLPVRFSYFSEGRPFERVSGVRPGLVDVSLFGSSSAEAAGEGVVLTILDFGGSIEAEVLVLANLADLGEGDAVFVEGGEAGYLGEDDGFVERVPLRELRLASV